MASTKSGSETDFRFDGRQRCRRFSRDPFIEPQAEYICG
jgi:hypothetical protein